MYVDRIMMLIDKYIEEDFSQFFLSLSLSQDGSSAESILEALKKVSPHYDLSVFCIAYMKHNVFL